MKSITSQWYEVRVRYEKMTDDGTPKPMKESYVVDALTFTEAESIITEEMSVYISGEFNIEGIKLASYKEIFFSDLTNDDHWFKAKLQFITFDEKTQKEKRSAVSYLVQAHTLPQAVKYIGDVMGQTMVDYVISNISETNILDVFEHKDVKSTSDAKPEYEQGQ